jgi:hypothetical protein
MSPEQHRGSLWQDRCVALWAVYSDRHTEVSIGGDRDGLRALATAVARGEPDALNLDDPPMAWQEAERSLRAIHVQPKATTAARIRFQRGGQVLIISGQAGELARILGRSITQLADGPAKINTVAAHLHLDPTSDPERRVYAPDSISLVIEFAETDD